jgi:riboflavin kinase/FMN adenylyltransferase
MEIIHINQLSIIEQETVATVGFFDGVHRGHRYLINRLKNQAQVAGLKTAVITFPVHPRKILQQDYQPKLLNTFEERLQQLASTGIDYCYLMDFTPEFSEITARDFIQEVLRKQLHVKELLVGYDHRFGKRRENEYENYADYGEACGMKVVQAESLPETGHTTSSTVIRRLLSEGKMKEAAQSLSYNYRLEGEVVHGNKLGRTIGFPTANIALDEPDKVIPMEGVYAVGVQVEGQNYLGMTYIGTRPTVASGSEKRIEVNIFDFDKEIYGERLQMEFTDFLRPDIHFNGLAELKTQLAEDRQQAICCDQ